MRVNWIPIKIIVLLLVLAGLFGFANYRVNSKSIEDIQIKFLGDNNLYLTEEAVNKLLIQNHGSVKNRSKDAIILNDIEEVIEANPMVKNAQVYLSVKGELISEIQLRKPIARIAGVDQFYLDDIGERMPLSKYHSARVPLITGKISGEALKDVYKILEHVNLDEFLRKNIIGIHIEDKGSYILKLRLENFEVRLGGAEDLDHKFKNFIAFYLKATKDKTLNAYAAISLEFDNQVVCTKL
ncbi:cell division protein FtsQ/DivIB [Croceivirga thetidis]|uniref:Cell division protein FtsQ n=1 Tax=Croceivirga thetidis TaxID=2721623 RepID=A0ABX1GMV3_9FLAO|nr:cell division protein FtsQ/DivIB [Croceivirga thetidis]NKI30400.1 hypothetical protein [Croceivirga thetidis]